MKSALFSLFGENLRPVWRIWQLWRWKFDLAKTCSAWPEKRVLYNFHEKRTAFSFWREFEASVTILTTLTLTNAIWPKRATHDLKRAFCTISMESALFSRFEENFRPVWRFWQLWRTQMRFGENVLHDLKRAFCKISWKAHCFPVLKRIWGKFHDFDLLKTISLGKNGWISERAAQNGKMAKMALFWQNLLKTVCFGQNVFLFCKSSLRQWFCPKMLKSGKHRSKLCNSAKVASFWQNLLKTVFQGKNGLILKRAAQNGKMAKMALFWHILLKTVCFGQNGSILAKDAQNSGFGQNGFFFRKSSLRQWSCLKLPKSGKRCWKLCNLAKMALFRQNLLKTVFWGKNGLILERAVQNGKIAKMALFWQNLLKTVCCGQNGFILEKYA